MIVNAILQHTLSILLHGHLVSLKQDSINIATWPSRRLETRIWLSMERCDSKRMKILCFKESFH